ncbi:MAG TPA: hypothetical protein VJ878_04535, partial [Candidatus Izemoplasmatales bacterium]|nr:hypothetical protein [Candidatus Izemoplasmatales bacterium]
MYYLCMMMVFLGFLHPDINVVGDYQKEEMMYVYGNYKEKGYLLAYHRENENIHFEITYDSYDENY